MISLELLSDKDCWNNTLPFQKKVIPQCRISLLALKKSVSEIKGCACTPYPMQMTFPEPFRQIPVLKNYPPIEVTAYYPLQLQWVCCSIVIISTTNICFWTTVKRTCKSLRNPQGICTLWPDIAVPTKSTRNGSSAI